MQMTADFNNAQDHDFLSFLASDTFDGEQVGTQKSTLTQPVGDHPTQRPCSLTDFSSDANSSLMNHCQPVDRRAQSMHFDESTQQTSVESMQIPATNEFRPGSSGAHKIVSPSTRTQENREASEAGTKLKITVSKPSKSFIDDIVDVVMSHRNSASVHFENNEQ